MRASLVKRLQKRTEAALIKIQRRKSGRIRKKSRIEKRNSGIVSDDLHGAITDACLEAADHGKWFLTISRDGLDAYRIKKFLSYPEMLDELFEVKIVGNQESVTFSPFGKDVIKNLRLQHPSPDDTPCKTTVSWYKKEERK